MIDEAIKNKVLPAAKVAAKQVSVGFLVFSESFRWIEFSAAVGAAFASGLALAAQLGLPASQSKWVGMFGAAVGGLCYIRKPTTSHLNDSPAPAVGIAE